MFSMLAFLPSVPSRLITIEAKAEPMQFSERRLAPASLTSIDSRTMNTAKKSPWLKGVIASAIFVVVPPLVGVAGTVIGMVRSFSAISSGGAASPPELSQGISIALWATAAGITISAIAAIALVVCIIGLVLERRRSRLGVSGSAS